MSLTEERQLQGYGRTSVRWGLRLVSERVDVAGKYFVVRKNYSAVPDPVDEGEGSLAERTVVAAKARYPEMIEQTVPRPVTQAYTEVAGADLLQCTLSQSSASFRRQHRTRVLTQLVKLPASQVQDFLLDQ